MNSLEKKSGPAIKRCRGILCAIAAASGIAACGLDSVDGDNASITVAQAAAPTAAQRARAVQEPRVATHGPWRVERIDRAESDKPLYVLTPANPLDPPGTRYTVRSTGGAGRSHTPSGAPAVIAGHHEDERVAGQRAVQ